MVSKEVYFFRLQLKGQGLRGEVSFFASAPLRWGPLSSTRSFEAQEKQPLPAQLAALDGTGSHEESDQAPPPTTKEYDD